MFPPPRGWIQISNVANIWEDVISYKKKHKYEYIDKIWDMNFCLPILIPKLVLPPLTTILLFLTNFTDASFVFLAKETVSQRRYYHSVPRIAVPCSMLNHPEPIYVWCQSTSVTSALIGDRFLHLCSYWMLWFVIDLVISARFMLFFSKFQSKVFWIFPRMVCNL